MQQRTPVAGPAFLRQLAQRMQVEVPASSQPLSERLSQWFDWNRAVALSRALDVVPAAVAAETPADIDWVAECARARAVLVEAIDRVRDPAADPPRRGEADVAAFRQRYLALQRSMLASTGKLRGQLRDQLAAHGGELARLAELDGVMELALSPREQGLLASVPALLDRHFANLQPAPADASDVDADATATPVDSPVTGEDADHDRFRRDMHALLLAELEVRFHPIEGLLAALRSPQAPSS